MKSTLTSAALSLAVAFALVPAAHAKKQVKTWTDPELAQKEDPDFLVQGEYGSADESAGYGVQVVALGGGKFDGYLLEGGLPGAGWERGKWRIVLKGQTKDGKVEFSDEGGKITGVIEDGKMVVNPSPGGDKVTLPRIERKSPTLGAKPAEGAVVLFDGTDADQWENGTIKDGLLQATSCTSKPKFKSYKLHLEFRTPYMPEARGQGRGNSGIYHSGRWETQILDSFGLEGRDNEAGGIYSVSKPRLNMCLPPLAWQTYDVDFTAAKFDAEGNRTAWPRITVRLNGVLVHEDLELPKDFTTAAPIKGKLTGPEGPVFLQNHSNPVVFRNIWVVPGE